MDAYPWLLWLSILYVVILVIALAAGLIAIARALIITRKNLAKIEGGLAQVEAQTKPLAGSLQTINAALAEISGGLLVLLERLRGSDASLTRLVEKFTARR